MSNRNPPPNKIVLSLEDEEWICNHYDSMSNRELAAHFGMRIQTFRVKLYEMGLKRMDLEYWTDEQVRFLRENYRTIGDKELASIMQQRWPKIKSWTPKHVEKKRLYLKLKRTRQELADIHQRNVDNGCFLLCPVKRWDVTGRAEEGEIRMWRHISGRMVPFVKVNGRFVHWAPWAWEQANGPVPDGMCVVFLGDTTVWELSNLELITRQEHSRRSSLKSSQGMSDRWVAGVLSHGNPELRKVLLARPDCLKSKDFL